MNTLNKTFLPVTLDECHARGWDTSSYDRPRKVARYSATKRVYAGSFCLPRYGTGAR